jgi:hypothetical protein
MCVLGVLMCVGGWGGQSAQHGEGDVDVRALQLF